MAWLISRLTKRAARHHAVLIVDGRARLTHHLVNRRMRRVGVIPRAGEHRRHVRVDVFVIRQIDIHQTLQMA